jgi:cytochrome c oxidase subunit III
LSTAAHPHPHGAPAVWPPDQLFGSARPAKLAMWIFLLSDWLSFAGLLLAYGILRGASTVWRHPGEPSLNIPFTALLTLVLAVSSVTIIRAYDAAASGNRRGTNLWLAVTGALGLLFLTGQYAEWVGILHPGLLKEGLVFGQSAYASTFYVITGFHGLHVVTGCLYVLITLFRSLRGRSSANAVELLGLFWHFVDFVWNIVFVLVYLIPIGS